MEVPVLVEKKEYCCGCGACISVCKVNAITMKCDEYGFEFPVIDERLCVGCGGCKKSCAYQNKNNLNLPDLAFAAVSTSTDVMNSASGGVFASIADKFLNQHNCAVVGAALEYINGTITTHHITVSSADNLHKLLGSKYVHSDTTEIFNNVKILLNSNTKVLFSGTPCQVAALYSFLGKEYDNLFTIDLICHGVPSKKMFEDYIAFISNKYGKVKDFIFRDKKKGLTFVSRAVCEKNGKESTKYIQYGESSYYTYFLQGNTYRDCCYSCKYATEKRIGDITIGDFWGIRTQHPELFDGTHTEFDSDKGISCILVNTQKGKYLVNTYGFGLSLYESTFAKIAEENKQLNEPSVPKGNRKEIMEIYKSNGYSSVDRYFKNQAGSAIVISKIKSKIPLGVKKLLKK